MSETKKKKRLGVTTKVAAFFGAALALGAFGALAYLNVPAGRIAHGVRVGPIALGGMETSDAQHALADAYAGLTFTYLVDGKTVTLSPSAQGAIGIGGFASFDAASTAAAAERIGKGNSPRAMLDLVLAAVKGADEADFVKTDFRAGELRAALMEKLKGQIAEAHDARLIVRIARDDKPSMETQKETDGVNVDYQSAAQETLRHLNELSATPITVPTSVAPPAILAAQIEPLKAGVAAALARGPLSLTARDRTWTVSRSLLADWLNAVPAADGKGAPRLGLDPDKVTRYLDARTVDLQAGPKNAVFEMKDGKVTKFVPGEDGQKLDPEGSLKLLDDAVFGPTAPAGPLALSMTLSPPDITTGDSNKLGIKEIIGVGATNFAGSPKNRIHNVQIGAAAVNYSLIMPGDEFSMLKTLGTIDASTGYLEELVIKGNETKPEFGGGLCQIGSTAFRATLDSGLPVTVRQNHSYRVSYYEKDGDGKNIGPGKDATIYDPAPDYRFLNDTGHAILITTAIKGNKLTFTFWGTKDGRTAAQTAAKVYNLVDPPEKKVVETDKLKPGEEKCTEHAHVGSDAVFTYTVTFPNGQVKAHDFKSHYKPWQEVCLIGVTPETLAAHAAAAAADTAALPSQDAAGVTGN
ncbi:MAG: hypothetical protein RLZZ324_1196 [Candidatus Parcubacteria bacterium]|jgi:vancomycin resistance protein YoaR